MNITYTKYGDYYYPDLTLPPQPAGDIDREANEQIDLITSRLAQAEGVTEDLKARDQLCWIRAMNSCRARAEAQVNREIVLA